MTQFLLLLLVGLAAVTVSSARIQKRIVNGDVAGYAQFPYTVSMRMTTTSSHSCGGSLVTPEHVVTAAHCLGSGPANPVLPTERFIVSGHLNNAAGGRVTLVSEVRIHPEYNAGASWLNDIAVLKLATPIPFTATEQPIPIASVDTGVESCIVSGWGRLHSPGSALPTQLQKQVFNTMTWETCTETWPPHRIYNSTLCAGGQRGIGVCNGDSGGPLVCNGELAGVVSWGNACANARPDMYARVFYFTDWILDNIADLSPLGHVYAAEALEARQSQL